MKKAYLLFILIATVSSNVSAGSKDSVLKTKVTQWMSNASGIRFLENKGQLMDMERKPVPDVLYEAASGGMNVYVTTSGLSYVFVKLDKHKKKNSSPIHFPKGKEHNDSVTETWCRADMQLVGASIKKENIVQEGESTDRSDYYYGDVCPNGILGVHSYEKITIKNIYPGIDWVLHSGTHGLKYDFIVHPGADPSLIKLKYKWTDKPQLQEDGSIKISTPMGNITEGTPASYSNGERVQTTYMVKDSEVHFNVSNYNSRQTLIIDPKLVWATYYGNGANPSEEDDILSMQTDGSNVWLAGLTTSSNFATYNPGGGAYFQGTAQGYGTIILLKFTTNGILRWATYYGGNGDYDWANSIYSDKHSVWVTGYASSTNFPLLNPGGGAYFQSTLGVGGINVFILEFDTACVRKWATYYGGSGQDQGYSINSDGKNVWVTGGATSSNFPLLNPGGGAYYQGAIGDSAYSNAFILQFNTAGVRKWATYYGGSASPLLYGDVGYSICSDRKSVWVTGYTDSPTFPIYNPGKGTYFQGTNGGLQNAFILRFDSTGVRKWATYYGGNDSLYGDIGYSINSDGKNVWVTGQAGSSNFPTQNPGNGAYFQGKLAAQYQNNAFILQFDTVGVRKWATYYGGNANGGVMYGDEGYNIQSDGTNVWVCGATVSTNFPTLNPGCGFYQNNIGIFQAQDVFILQFTTTGVRKWATYYGVDDEDDGSYVWSDGTNLFVAGDAYTTYHGGYPTVNPGGAAYYDTIYPTNGNEVAFIGKFLIQKFGISPPTSICRGDFTTLHATGGSTYAWSPPNGLSTTNIPDPIANPTVTTTYTLISDSGGCTDTNTVTVTVAQRPVINACCDTSLISGQSVRLSASGSGSYLWSPPSGLSCDTCSNPIATPSVTTRYYVTVSDSGCTAKDSVLITVLAPAEACGTVFVPDVFSPNETHNSILYVRGNCIASMDFSVFDRWGNKVFESQHINDGWDGTYTGKPMNTATYIWSLKATLQDGTSIEKKGDVTLVR